MGIGSPENDMMNAKTAGDHWFFGGPGNDAIWALFSTYCLIEGGAGSDVLIGSFFSGTQIFGAVYGEMEDLIEAGETADSIDQRGDLIADASQGHDNYLYGSNANDFLLVYGGGAVKILRVFKTFLN
jgi:Ca2+-binding RTX toxin-like protein